MNRTPANKGQSSATARSNRNRTRSRSNTRSAANRSRASQSGSRPPARQPKPPAKKPASVTVQSSKQHQQARKSPSRSKARPSAQRSKKVARPEAKLVSAPPSSRNQKRSSHQTVKSKSHAAANERDEDDDDEEDQDDEENEREDGEDDEEDQDEEGSENDEDEEEQSDDDDDGGGDHNADEDEDEGVDDGDDHSSVNSNSELIHRDLKSLTEYLAKAITKSMSRKKRPSKKTAHVMDIEGQPTLAVDNTVQKSLPDIVPASNGSVGVSLDTGEQDVLQKRSFTTIESGKASVDKALKKVKPNELSSSAAGVKLRSGRELLAEEHEDPEEAESAEHNHEHDQDQDHDHDHDPDPDQASYSKGKSREAKSSRNKRRKRTPSPQLMSSQSALGPFLSLFGKHIPNGRIMFGFQSASDPEESFHVSNFSVCTCQETAKKISEQEAKVSKLAEDIGTLQNGATWLNTLIKEIQETLRTQSSKFSNAPRKSRFKPVRHPHLPIIEIIEEQISDVKSDGEQ